MLVWEGSNGNVETSGRIEEGCLLDVSRSERALFLPSGGDSYERVLKGWVVYRFDWEDGSRYVGMTRRSMSRRLSDHRNDRRGRLVTDKFRELGDPTVTIMSKHRYEYTAAEAETRLIRKYGLDRLLNQHDHQGYFRPRPRDYYGRGRVRCTWCKRLCRPADMSRDRTRSRGYGSKCKACYRSYTRVCWWLVKDKKGADYSLCYRVARGWAESGRDPNKLRKEVIDEAVRLFSKWRLV